MSLRPETCLPLCFRRSMVAATSGGSDLKPICPAAENSGRNCEPVRNAG